MSFLPNSVSAAVGSNDMSGPAGLRRLDGVGMPGMSVSGNGGPTADSTRAMVAGLGVGTMSAMHVGQHTSSTGVFGTPIIQFQNQFMIDLSLTGVHEIGDHELHFIDLESGTPGIDGQNQPHAFKSLSILNAWLRSREGRLKYGAEKSAHWFNQRFAFAGAIVHEDTHNRPHLDSGIICQTFTIGGQAQIYDLFQAYQPKGVKNKTLGADVNDMLWLVLRSFEYTDQMEIDLPLPGGVRSPPTRFWQLCPFYSKCNEIPPVCSHSLPHLGIQGEAYKVGRVLHIYNAPGDQAVARRIAYNTHLDGKHKADFQVLRKLAVQIFTT